MQKSVKKIVIAVEKNCTNFHCSMQQSVQVFIVACNKVPKFSLQHATKCPSFHYSMQQSVQVFIIACKKVSKFCISCKKVYIISFIIVVVTSMFSGPCQYAWINMSFQFYFRQKYFQALLTRLRLMIQKQVCPNQFRSSIDPDHSDHKSEICH